MHTNTQTNTRTHTVCNICVYHCLVQKSWYECVIFLESSLASEKITIKKKAKVHFAQHGTSECAVIFPAQTHTMGHMTSALISHTCAWWNKAALLSLTLAGSLAWFHKRGGWGVRGIQLQHAWRKLCFHATNTIPAKRESDRRHCLPNAATGVSRCVWVRSPQLKIICKKKKSMYWSGGGEGQQRQTQMEVGSSLCSARRSRGEEKSGAPRSGAGLLRCVRDWDSGERRKLWNLDEETKAVCLQIFCFFAGANVKARSAVQKQSLFYSRPTARGRFRKQTAHK